MKRWQAISALALSFTVSLVTANRALADDAEDIPPVLATIITKTAVLLNGLLDYWVNAATGNTVTDPAGEQLIGSIGQVIVNVVHFFAQLVTFF